jgi:NAD(P)H-dependent FMN reductase
MPAVLLVAHTPTPSLDAIADAVAEGVGHPELDGAVQLVRRPALEATAEDVLAADAVILLTPVNLGYISGALKHFFDSTFRELEGRTGGMPFLAVIKGTTDATGAIRAIDAITTGLSWRPVQPHVVIEGDVDPSFLDRVREAAGTVAASLVL